jgi:hypothetical protein
MAQMNAFNAALTRIGFNVDTTERLVDEGLDTLETLADLEEADIDKMIKIVRENRRALGANAPGNITFPFLPTKRLKAMRHWAAELKRTGRPLNNAGLFAGLVMNTAVARYSLDLLRSELAEEEMVDKPKDLLDLMKWETFWEQFKTYMGRLRGAAKCPLTYVFREHAAVDPAMHLLAYQDHDARLVATTELLGPWYEVDNHRVYNEFKSLVLKGPGWSFVKSFDRARNGRDAILTLKRQCEGTSAIQSRKASAYAKIATARYSGHKKAFTFDNYVEIHQNTHNTMADVDEPVPETKKVTDFLTGITDSRLSNAKDLILGDPNKLQNFEACQQYLKTLVYNKATQEKHQRQISGLGQNQDKSTNKTEDGKGKTCGGKQANGGTPEGGKVVARQYTKAEWSKLTPEQRAKVKELRANKKRKLPGNRNASGVQSGDAYDTASTDLPLTTTAHITSQATTMPPALRNSQIPPTASRSVRFAKKSN